MQATSEERLRAGEGNQKTSCDNDTTRDEVGSAESEREKQRDTRGSGALRTGKAERPQEPEKEKEMGGGSGSTRKKQKEVRARCVANIELGKTHTKERHCVKQRKQTKRNAVPPPRNMTSGHSL